MPDWRLEREGEGLVCGIDEAGRGPWAGPVVAAAVILEPARMPPALAAAIDDSKKMSPRARERAAAALAPCARIGVGEASVAEIDRLNILNATLLAMARAFERLCHEGPAPERALIDGPHCPALGRGTATQAVIGGDGKSLSIAAASIVAKVHRDRIMAALAHAHPGYGFERNAGYGTKAHREGLERLGATPHHRRSFAPIQAYLSKR